MIEIEFKAALSPAGRAEVLLALRRFPGVRIDPLIYRDTYYDQHGTPFRRSERELRLRRRIPGKVGPGDFGATAEHSASALLTWKGEPLDPVLRSKEEIEVGIGSPETMAMILEVLGFIHDVEVEKQCVNFRFRYQDREVVATVADLPLLGRSFLEVEILVKGMDEARIATDVLAELLASLSIHESCLTAEYYTDMVRAHGFPQG